MVAELKVCSDEWYVQRRKLIISLYNAGLKNREISETMTSQGFPMTRHQVSSYLSSLRRRGRLKSMKRSTDHPGPKMVQDDPRLQLIVTRLRQKVSLRAIGKELGISAGRVRELREKIIKVHGEKILRSDSGQTR